jgi:hypothetical protein
MDIVEISYVIKIIKRKITFAIYPNYVSEVPEVDAKFGMLNIVDLEMINWALRYI